MSVSTITKILTRALEGDYSVRVDTEQTESEFKELAEAVNTAIEFVIDSKKTCDNVQMMIQQNPVPMMLLDCNFMAIDMNSAYEKMMDMDRAKLMKMDASDYKIKMLSGEGADKLFSSGKKTTCTLEFTFKDGRKLIVEQQGVPLRDENGNIEIGLFVFNDITLQKEEEEEIQKQLAKNKALQERSEVIVQENPMPIILCDKGFNIRVVNPAYSDLSGISIDKLLTMTLRDFEVLETEGEGLKHVFETKSRSHGVVTVKFPKGVRIVEQYGIPIMNPKGEIASVLIVYNDITEVRNKQREVEALMEEAQKKAAILEESVEEVARGMHALKDGDFTLQLAIKPDDPLETLKEDYNNAISESRLLFADAVEGMNTIQNNMSDAASGSNEIAKAAEQVAIGSQKSAELSRTLQIQIENITRAISDLSASNEEIASTSQEVLDQAKSVAGMGKDAQDLGVEATEKMNSVADITKESVVEMGDLNKQLLEINNVVKLINDITNQINMLALNAAIEAARAGEHGRGFAVVAGEVKNLATEARNATAQIDTVISGIQKTSEKTATSIQSANTQVVSGVGSVNAAIESLNKIVKGAEQVSINMSEIAKAIEDQANITNNIVSDSEKSNDITLKTQNEIEELAALSEETSASVEEINSAIHEVTTLSDDLSKSLSHLKV
ncbi:MAG: PAS domain-containing methyl-accepting chemotaxis protein [Methanomicrobiaceae archaeon]|nr:PAS domain-containing methyl-accepting chemotaxis protein [Methanomicrobiaceae archaeon]